MNCEQVGTLLRRLRKEQKLTQRELAERIGVSDKAVSKWENGLGCPDISLLRDLSKALHADVERILAGSLNENDRDGGNMKRTKFYQCPECGNIIASTGEAVISCCGRKLEALKVRDADEEHRCTIEKIEEDIYLTFKHEMRKDHFISFAAYLTGDKLLISRLYPEQGAEARFPMLQGGGTLYLCCNKHGLWKQKM